MNPLDRKLELWTAREPDGQTIAAAQQSLNAALADSRSHLRRRRVRRAGGWAAAMATALLVATVPLVFTPGPAFARAQKHLGDFQTLGFDLEVFSGDALLMRGHVIMTPDGNYRHTWGDILAVRDRTTGRKLTLFKVPRLYLEKDAAERNQVDQWIELIASLRRFDGNPVKLPETRMIRGRQATGWTLTVRDKPATLWADENGFPLELEVQQSARSRWYYRFAYNAPITGDTFDTSIPEGYRSAAPEEAECLKTGRPIWTAVHEAEYTDPATGEKKWTKYRMRYDCKRHAS